MLKRPYVEEFLQKMGELFECVLFTASLGKVSVLLMRHDNVFTANLGKVSAFLRALGTFNIHFRFTNNFFNLVLL